MCGISGVLSFGSLRERDLDDLERMHRILAHRGPDGEGWLLIDRHANVTVSEHRPAPGGPPLRAAFAFRRLRIQDLSRRADQPFRRPQRRQWILFNGEIYNHSELRGEIGGTFDTHSDTEVALAAWDRWGSGCFSRFAGMWAMIVVDLERGVIAGSRDRLGIKPLCHATESDRILIASEPKAIASVAADGPRIERSQLRRFLAGFPATDPELTFFEGIRMLPSASWFEIPLAGPVPPSLRPRAYWDLAPFTAEEAVVRDGETQFGAALERAVRSHLAADVPVGALLSGGLDSSTIARLMAIERRRSGLPAPRTFSLVYDDPRMDESIWIRAMIDQGDLDPAVRTFDADEALELAPDVVTAQGEPLLGQELIAQFRAFAFAREHGVIVVLDGQGADEILGGYPRHESNHLRGLLRTLRIGEALAEARALAPRRRISPLRLLASAWRSGGPRRSADSDGWGPGEEPVSFDESSLAGGRSREALNRALFTQTRVTNLPAVLQYEDRNSMAHSVEARVPFLDHELVELAFRLPAKDKIHRGDRKRVLRTFGSRILPADVVSRTDKKAFVSLSDWLQLRRYPDHLHALVDGLGTMRDAGLRGESVRSFLETYRNGRHDDHLGAWRLYTCWLWLTRFRPTAARGSE